MAATLSPHLSDEDLLSARDGASFERF